MKSSSKHHEATESDDRGTRERALRNEVLSDPRWYAYQQGTLSPQEEAALRALAETDPVYREALELLSPRSQVERDRIWERAKRIADDPESALEFTTRRGVSVEIERPPAAPPRPPARLLWWRGTSTAVASAVVACVVTLMLGKMTEPPPEKNVPVASASSSVVRRIPPYGVAVRVAEEPIPGQMSSGNDVALGDDADHRLTLKPGQRLSLTLTPATPVEGDFEVRGFLVGSDGTIEDWPGPSAPKTALIQRPSGRVTIDGSGKELFGSRAGVWSVVVVIGRAGGMPDGSPAWAEYLRFTRSPTNLDVRLERVIMTLSSG